MVDRETIRSLATRAGLYEPPPSMLGREVALLAAGVGVGALIMFLLDPDEGRRRRALARDQMTSLVTNAEKSLSAKARHLSNRARGVVAEAKASVEPEQPF